MKATLSFKERLEMFNEPVTNLKDYVFSYSILKPEKIDGDNYCIKEKKNNITTVALNIADLKEHKKTIT